MKAALNRRHDGSVCSHPVLGVAHFVDYRSRLHGMCTLYWDDASQWWATKGLWLSVVEENWIPIPDSPMDTDSDEEFNFEFPVAIGKAWLATYDRVNFGDVWQLLAAAKCVREFPWRHVLWFLVSHLSLPPDLDKLFKNIC